MFLVLYRNVFIVEWLVCAVNSFLGDPASPIHARVRGSWVSADPANFENAGDSGNLMVGPGIAFVNSRCTRIWVATKFLHSPAMKNPILYDSEANRSIRHDPSIPALPASYHPVPKNIAGRACACYSRH